VRILDRATVRRLCLLIPGPVTDQASWARVIRHARCADGSLDPDQWFPVSAEAGKARQEAAAAIAICTTCLVRAQCLALSLQHWDNRPARCLGRPGRSRTRGIAPRRQANLTRKAHVDLSLTARIQMWPQLASGLGETGRGTEPRNSVPAAVGTFTLGRPAAGASHVSPAAGVPRMGKGEQR